MAKIRRKNDVLLIAGEVTGGHSLEKEILKLKDDSIILDLRCIENDKLQHYFNASDVCVLPYKEVTNSGLLLLAMSFGKPVICADKGSISEIIKPDFGILYKKDEDLAKAMINIRSSDLEQMVQKSFEEAKKYNWDDMAEKYIEAYDYALKAPHN